MKFNVKVERKQFTKFNQKTQDWSGDVIITDGFNLGENARIIFNYFAIENDKLFLAFYEPIYYVDLDDYLNNTENIIEKLAEETEK